MNNFYTFYPTKEQMEFIKRIKGDIIQGYYYSKPIPKEEFEEYLRKLTCRGCFHRCPLNRPNCGRSSIFIKEAEEKFQEMVEKKND